MTQEQDETAGYEATRYGAVVRRPHRRLELTFEAFLDTHHRAWLRFAHLQVGNRPAATRIADAACAQLADHWPHALQQESVSAYAWAVLKEHLAAWLTAHGRITALVETAGFDAASQVTEDNADRDRFSLLENDIGLYAAISELPERQYDVIVLRYALGYPDEQVARLLGLRQNAVRTHIRHAKRALAANFGIDWKPVTGE